MLSSNHPNHHLFSSVQFANSKSNEIYRADHCLNNHLLSSSMKSCGSFLFPETVSPRSPSHHI
ncbi:hypothetical protein HanRHA438_Chr13g0623911 [Helianthus annuus]|nr:hypothetical protein HanRHA438_Chr13g0623911 [Helianthus annuus]